MGLKYSEEKHRAFEISVQGVLVHSELQRKHGFFDTAPERHKELVKKALEAAISGSPFSLPPGNEVSKIEQEDQAKEDAKRAEEERIRQREEARRRVAEENEAAKKKAAEEERARKAQAKAAAAKKKAEALAAKRAAEAEVQAAKEAEIQRARAEAKAEIAAVLEAKRFAKNYLREARFEIAARFHRLPTPDCEVQSNGKLLQSQVSSLKENLVVPLLPEQTPLPLPTSAFSLGCCGPALESPRQDDADDICQIADEARKT